MSCRGATLDLACTNLKDPFPSLVFLRKTTAEYAALLASQKVCKLQPFEDPPAVRHLGILTSDKRGNSAIQPSKFLCIFSGKGSSQPILQFQLFCIKSLGSSVTGQENPTGSKILWTIDNIFLRETSLLGFAKSFKSQNKTSASLSHKRPSTGMGFFWSLPIRNEECSHPRYSVLYFGAGENLSTLQAFTVGRIAQSV